MTIPRNTSARDTRDGTSMLDGRPTVTGTQVVGEGTDKLLDRLRHIHGEDGREDIPPGLPPT